MHRGAQTKHALGHARGLNVILRVLAERWFFANFQKAVKCLCWYRQHQSGERSALLGLCVFGCSTQAILLMTTRITNLRIWDHKRTQEIILDSRFGPAPIDVLVSHLSVEWCTYLCQQVRRNPSHGLITLTGRWSCYSTPSILHLDLYTSRPQTHTKRVSYPAS